MNLLNKAVILTLITLSIITASCKPRVKPEDGKGEAKKTEAVSTTPAPHVAQVIFLPPPKNELYPEREQLAEAFRKSAESTFNQAGWLFTELDLSKILFTKWGEEIANAVVKRKVLVFTFGDAYVPFLKELAWDKRFNLTVVVALTSPLAKTSPRVVELSFNAEEIGFLAGIMASQLTVTGNVAVFAFSDDYYSDLMVAGLSQGLLLERRGAHVRDLRISRQDAASPQNSKKLASLFENANKGLDPRFGIDVVVSFLGALGEEFMRSLAEGGTPVISSLVYREEKSRKAFVTSLLYDFSSLPAFLVKNEQKLQLFRNYPLIKDAQIPSKGQTTASQVDSQEQEYPSGPRVYQVGLKDGLITTSGFRDYQRFHSLPIDFLETLDYYTKAIIAGEIKIKKELPED